MVDRPCRSRYYDDATRPEPSTISDPLAVPAEDVAARLDFYLDAVMRSPVGITREGTMRVVMLSLKDYARLVRRDRRVVGTADLEEETLDAILNAEPGERSKDAGRRVAHAADE